MGCRLFNFQNSFTHGVPHARQHPAVIFSILRWTTTHRLLKLRLWMKNNRRPDQKKTSATTTGPSRRGLDYLEIPGSSSGRADWSVANSPVAGTSDMASRQETTLCRRSQIGRKKVQRNGFCWWYAQAGIGGNAWERNFIYFFQTIYIILIRLKEKEKPKSLSMSRVWGNG